MELFFPFKPYHLATFKRGFKGYLLGKIKNNQIIQAKMVGNIGQVLPIYKEVFRSDIVHSLMKTYMKEENLQELPKQVRKDIINIYI